jgi:MinD-like ATPase involved in chromosome partitioning or flagellar assembly
MTLRVATVLSARDWEARLVAGARSSASVRLVLRAFRPEEVAERAASLDVVVVGSETPWATPARIASWLRLGLRVVGIHPVGDRPAAERFRSCGVDLALADDLESEAMLREIRMLEPGAARPDAGRPLIAVTGGRGAPGRTEVAVSLAWALSGRGPTTLVDVDLEAPAVAIRLAVSPRPDLTDAVDHVHDTGTLPGRLVHRVGRLDVIPGSHRPAEATPRPEPVFDVVDAARSSSRVIVDTGPWPQANDIVKAADHAVVVVDGSPTGIVRAASLIADWTGPPPRLVVNRITSRGRVDAVRAVRRWTGLEPVVVVPWLRAVPPVARSGAPPPRALLRALRPLIEELGR